MEGKFSSAFTKILAEVEQAYGSILRPARKGEQRRLPTGVFNIDYCLKGGLPINRISLISGHKACYKTTLALKAVRQYQSRCGYCFDMKEDCRCGHTDRPYIAIFIDCEHALNENHVERLGVELGEDRLWIFKPPHGEAACEYAERFANTPEVGMIIIDSLAVLVPETELESGYFDKMSRSLRARLIARMFRALAYSLDNPDRPRVFIALNHLLPSQSGPGDLLPGGEEQKYLSSLVIRLWTAKKKYLVLNKKGEEEEEDEEESKKKVIKEEEPTKLRKQHIGFMIEHSKVSPDMLKGEFELFLGEDPGKNIIFGDTDDYDSVFNRGIKLGIIGGDGNGWVLPDVGSGIIDEKMFSSQKAVKDLWRNDRLLFERFKARLIRNADLR